MIIRPASPEDASTIFGFVCDLAEFEKCRDKVELTLADYERFLREGDHFHGLIAEDNNGDAIGMAIWYKRFSTWVGDYLHLEDLYVDPSARGEGTGTELIRSLGGIAHDLGMKRMEWMVLDWNESAIRTYERLGATVLPDWRLCMMQEDQLLTLISPSTGTLE